MSLSVIMMIEVADARLLKQAEMELRRLQVKRPASLTDLRVWKGFHPLYSQKNHRSQAHS